MAFADASVNLILIMNDFLPFPAMTSLLVFFISGTSQHDILDRSFCSAFSVSNWLWSRQRWLAFFHQKNWRNSQTAESCRGDYRDNLFVKQRAPPGALLTWGITHSQEDLWGISLTWRIPYMLTFESWCLPGRGGDVFSIRTQPNR